jgi:hypothetical protein
MILIPTILEESIKKKEQQERTPVVLTPVEQKERESVVLTPVEQKERESDNYNDESYNRIDEIRANLEFSPDGIKRRKRLTKSERLEFWKNVQEQHPVAAKALQLGQSAMQGLIGTAQGVAGYAKRFGVPGAEEVGDFLGEQTEKISEHDIEDISFPHHVASGAGSMVSILGPSIAVTKKIHSLLKATPRLARLTAGGLAALIESATEGGSAYNDLIERGFTHQEAKKAADTIAAINVILTGVTNKLGIFGENATKKAKGYLITAALEGSQEASQKITSDIAKGDKVNLKEVATEGAVGAVLGPGARFVVGRTLPTPDKTAGVSEKVDAPKQPPIPPQPPMPSIEEILKEGDANKQEYISQQQQANQNTGQGTEPTSQMLLMRDDLGMSETSKPRASETSKPTTRQNIKPIRQVALLKDLMDAMDAGETSKPETKPEIKPETKPEIKPLPDIDASETIKPDTRQETKPEIKPEIKPLPEIPQKTEASAEASADIPVYSGKPSKAFTDRGTQIETQFAIVDADNLITSHDTALNVNQSYPAELQPRQRERAASQLQINNILGKLNPELLGENPKASEGAPVVGSDFVVESGNGRVIALKKGYEEGHKNSESYRQWLFDNADSFGLSKEAISKINKPVLVRVRKTAVDRVSFAREANEQSIADMSLAEKARSDATQITEDLMSMFKPSATGELSLHENRNFISQFFQRVVPNAELARYIDKDGNLSQEGVRRVENALLYKAYEDIDVVGRLKESTDNNVRLIGNALLSLAPRVATVKAEIAKGNLHDLDIAKDITQALNKISQLKDRGMPVSDYINQSALFGDDITPLAKDVILMFDAYKKSGKKMAQVLNNYLDGLEALGNPKQTSIFGVKGIPTKAEILQAAIRKMEAKDAQIAFFQDKDAYGDENVSAYGRKGQGEETAVSKEGIVGKEKLTTQEELQGRKVKDEATGELYKEEAEAKEEAKAKEEIKKEIKEELKQENAEREALKQEIIDEIRKEEAKAKETTEKAETEPRQEGVKEETKDKASEEKAIDEQAKQEQERMESKSQMLEMTGLQNIYDITLRLIRKINPKAAKNIKVIKDTNKSPLGLIKELLGSPSTIIGKARYYVVMGKNAIHKEDRIRGIASEKLNAIYKSVKKHREEFDSLLWTAAAEGRTYTAEELDSMGVSPKVKEAYLAQRRFHRQMHRLIASHRKQYGKETGYIEGHMPHIFENWNVYEENDVYGKDASIVGTFKTLREAVIFANGLNPDKRYTIKPKMFRLPNDIGKASVLKDASFFALANKVEKQFELSRDEAFELLKGMAKIKGRHRYFGHTFRRKGQTGFRTDDTYDILKQYYDSAARYLAIDDFKARVIPKFEKDFGVMHGMAHSAVRDRFLAGYIEKYINDVSGVPGMRESAVDEAIKRYLGDFIKTDRPTMWTVNRVMHITGVLKLGIFNLSAGVVNLIQMINTFSKVPFEHFAWAFAHAILPKEKHKAILRRTGVTFDLGLTETGGYSMMRSSGKFVKASMFFFVTAEHLNRRAAALASYRYARKDLKYGERQALNYARQFVDETQFDYTVADTARIFRNPAGRLLGQFKPFAIKQIEFAVGLKGAENIKFWIPILLMSGLGGIPLSKGIADLIQWLTGKNPLTEVKKFLIQWAGDDEIKTAFAETAMYGILSQLGIDISRRVGLGDVLPQRPSDLLGPAINTILQATRQLKTAGSVDKTELIRTIAPSLGNAFTSIETVMESMQVKNPYKRQHLKYEAEPSDVAVKAMGLRPLEESKLADIETIRRYEVDKYNRLSRKYTDKAVESLMEGDADGFVNAVMEAAEKGVELNSTSIKKELVNRIFPQDIRMIFQTRKALRGEYMQLLEFLDEDNINQEEETSE